VNIPPEIIKQRKCQASRLKRLSKPHDHLRSSGVYSPHLRNLISEFHVVILVNTESISPKKPCNVRMHQSSQCLMKIDFNLGDTAIDADGLICES
jgi:hypothetical protein